MSGVLMYALLQASGTPDQSARGGKAANRGWRPHGGLDDHEMPVLNRESV
jgi:hypothetical protein